MMMLKLSVLYCIFGVILGKENTTSIEELIVGGQPAKFEEVPYQAALYFHNYFFCGGCIVTRKHIVSAAHCLIFFTSEPESIVVRVGTAKMHAGGQAVKVKRISLHPKFSLKTVDYDVSVAELKSPLQFGNGVRALHLGKKEPREGQEVRVSGWGVQKETGPPSRALQSVLVKVVDRKACAKNYTNRVVVTDRMICAAAENKDACYGDSGGPLVHQNKLIGIVSTGVGCARRNFPGIYTSVTNPEVRSFITKETGL